MRNSELAHLFTNNNLWKLVSISIIIAVFIPSSLNTITSFPIHIYALLLLPDFKKVDVFPFFFVK